MVRRRQVLIGGGIGMAAMGSALVPGAAIAAGYMPASHDIRLFLVDRSINSAVDVASRTHIPIAQYTEDIGAPWLNHLEPSWREEPHGVAGVTFAGAFFCLEQLARSYGLVCTFRSALPPTVQASSVRPLANSDRDFVSGRADQSAAIEAIVAAALRFAQSPSTRLLNENGVGSVAGDAPLVWLLQPRDGRQEKAVGRTVTS